MCTCIEFSLAVLQGIDLLQMLGSHLPNRWSIQRVSGISHQSLLGKYSEGHKSSMCSRDLTNSVVFLSLTWLLKHNMIYFGWEVFFFSFSIFRYIPPERGTGNLWQPNLYYLETRLEIKFLAGNHMYFEIQYNVHQNHLFLFSNTALVTIFFY